MMALILNTRRTSAAAFSGSNGDRRLKSGSGADSVDIAKGLQLKGVGNESSI